MKNNISKYVMYVILAVSVVALALLLILSGSDGHYGKISGDITGFNGLDILLWWSYILLAVGVFAAVIMSIVNVGKNPGGAKQGLVGLIVLAVVIGIAFLLSKTDHVAIAGGKEQYTNKGGLILADVGLYTAYFVLIAAVAVVIWGGIKNSFK